MRRLTKKGSLVTKRASGRSCTKLAKAVLISRMVLALRTRICNPMARAAASKSLNVGSAIAALAGLTSAATRTAVGTSSCKRVSRFAVNSAVKKLMPVRLPPGRQRRQPVNLIVGPAVFDRDVLALDISGVFKSLAESAQPVRKPIRRLAIEEPDHRHRLLRARREWPRRRAAKQRGEFAPLHRCDHSITSSARASKVGGTS